MFRWRSIRYRGGWFTWPAKALAYVGIISTDAITTISLTGSVHDAVALTGSVHDPITATGSNMGSIALTGSTQ